MKRLFIFAAAATVALASCTKTHVVYNEAPQEIGFKAVSGVMTKLDVPAVHQSIAGHENMGVIAYLSNTNTQYFANTPFSYDSEAGYWTAGNDPKYWPVDGSLDFTVYAPYDESNASYSQTTSESVTTKTLTITADNSTTGTDWLYGTDQPASSKIDNAINVTLAHALSYVDINVTGSNATLKKIELLSTVQKGTGLITYSASPITVVWTPATENSLSESLELYLAEDDANTNDITESEVGVTLSQNAINAHHLVIPTQLLSNEAIKLTYRLTGSTTDLTYTTTKADNNASPAVQNALGTTWAHGKKYIYNISITPKEIKFNPEVTEWDVDFDDDGDTEDDDTDITL